jgi:hypothetical protein
MENVNAKNSMRNNGVEGINNKGFSSLGEKG